MSTGNPWTTLAPYDAANVGITGGTAQFDAGAVGTPSIAFAVDPTTGFYRSGASVITVAAGGVASVSLGGSFVQLASSGSIAWTSTAASTGSADTLLQRGAAGIVKFGSANSFSANAAIATVLGSVGPTGSSTTVQKWLTIKDDGGTTRYIPCF